MFYKVLMVCDFSVRLCL